ncbi:hypothetical protein FRC03_003160 [Tulasnella sp. 419]|nr:hypothetical protein FRC03_003160 [Tulasnella sp. 419]
MLRYFINEYGKNLLSMGSSAIMEDLLLVHLFEACPCLRELILPITTIIPEDLRLTSYLPLTHLELVDREYVREEDVVQVVETIDWVMSLPNLRLVTFRIHKFNPDHYLAKLWTETSAGQVELEWIVTMNATLPGRDDMIRSSHFPRGKTIANLNQMTIPDGSSIT